jgi:hypothetical protein
VRTLDGVVGSTPGVGSSPEDQTTLRFEDVDICNELAKRPSRPPNHEREGAALALLARDIAENPRNMLQRLAEAATELCDAGTAGVSILDGDVFRWEAVAGVWSSARGSSMPRNASPCGVCVDRDATQLMHLTGYGQDADRRRSKEAGFNAHLVKPVNLDTLTNAVSH